MAENIEQIAKRLGAGIIGQMPGIGGGVLGAARLAENIESQRTRHVPEHDVHGPARLDSPALQAPASSAGPASGSGPGWSAVREDRRSRES